MKEELNTDEFESWLKSQADKHRMYPNDQLWRNINQQLHGNRRWPALTFGAILTGALVTASLIFLRPDKDLFNLPVVAANTPAAPTLTNVKNNINNLASVNVQALHPLSTKEVVYSFNSPANSYESGSLLTTEPAYILPENETLALNEPVTSHPANVSNVFTGTINLAKPVVLNAATVTSDALVPAFDNANQAQTEADGIENIQEQKSGQVVSLQQAEPEEAIAATKSLIHLPEVKKHRLHIELYGGPNINYRLLTEKRPYDFHLPYNATLTSANRSIVNSLVKQHPSIGFNVGTALAYSLSNRLKIKAGLQFNYRQYTIDAFRSKLERSVLLLNNGYTYPDSVYTYSVISNEQGKIGINLNNRFFQLSAPVSIEWTVAKVHRLDFNLSTSFQPTYQLNSNVYQITSDYKSYVQAPGLLRRWNMNAGAEATANFMAGGLQWQVGPQVRYQMLPTQKGNYSIREHLIDYGVKVGIVKQLR